MKKEVKLIAVPCRVEKLAGGMYVERPNLKIMLLSDSDAEEENSAEVREGYRVWQPVKLYLTSSDEPMDGDLCFNKDGQNPVEYKSGWEKKWFTKIIATPEQIKLTDGDINLIISEGGKCRIEMEVIRDGEPQPALADGKVIIHLSEK